MKNERHTSPFSSDRKGQIAWGPDQTDWDRVRATTDEQVEAAIAGDPDETNTSVDWKKATIAVPDRRTTMTLRIDADVLDFYRRMGRGYQMTINAVLRSYMDCSKG